MKTSIVGIIYSVTLTLLNTLFPIKAMRLDIFKRLENSLEMLWYKIHGEKIDPYQEKLLNILNHIYQESASLNKKFDKQSSGKDKVSGPRAA